MTTGVVQRQLITSARKLAPGRPPRGGVSAPTITSGPTATVTGQVTCTISWTLSQYCQGYVQYGLTAAYGSTSTPELSFNFISHSQQLSGLTAGTTYHYRVVSTNPYGLQVVSADDTFTTNASSGITYTPFTLTTGAGWTDGSDASANINSFVASKTDGADATHQPKIIFPDGYTYSIAAPIGITGRKNMTFNNPGNTSVPYGLTENTTNIQLIGPYSPGGSAFYQDGAACDTLTFQNLAIRGNSTNYSTFQAGDNGETQFGWALYSGKNIEISHCKVYRNKGDMVYMSHNGSVWCDNVWVHDSTCAENGRMGVAIISATNVLVENCEFRDVCYAPFDIEPNGPGEGAGNVLYQNNLISGKWSWGNRFSDAIWVVDGYAGTTLTGYYKILNNTVTAVNADQTGAPWVGWFKSQRGPSQKTAVMTVTGNNNTVAGPGYVMLASGWVNGGNISNNHGFLTTGGWYSDQGGNVGLVFSNNT